MTTWVYKRTEPGLWTVGFFDPEGEWCPESDHTDKDAAADRVHFLHGGMPVFEFEVDTVEYQLDEPDTTCQCGHDECGAC